MDISVKGTLNAIEAAAKEPAVKRFVYTSSQAAVYFGKPNVSYHVDENTWNEAAIKAASEPPVSGQPYNLMVHGAAKAKAEQALWQWVHQNKPSFITNTGMPRRSLDQYAMIELIDYLVVPPAVFGKVLDPQYQGYPITASFAINLYIGDIRETFLEFLLKPGKSLCFSSCFPSYLSL